MRALPLILLSACAAAPTDDADRRAPDAGTLGDTGCALDLVAEDADVTCGDVSVAGATAWIDCLGTWWVTSAYDGVSLAADDCTVVWVP